MEVLNAAGIAPATTLHRPSSISSSKQEPRKLFSLKLPRLPTSARDTHKPNLAEQVSRGVAGSLALVSSFLGGCGFAGALTYEEALQQSASGDYASFGESSGLDAGELIDGLVRFGSENPLVVGGGALAVVVPLVLSQLLSKPSKPWGVESARIAYSRLSEEGGGAQLLDIRETKDARNAGSPDLRSLKKKAVAVAYRKDDKNGFLKKLSLKFKDPGNTTLIVLDKFDGNSELVAELLTANGFKAAYAIKDGAEGPRGWKNSDLPWSEPKKTLSVDFSDLKETISEALGEGSDSLPVTLALAAATGVGVLAFSEIETVLQLLGSAAIVQFATKKLLFAKDRKVTLNQIDEFLNTKIAPKELADEIKLIGKALLPISTTGTASLPAPAEVQSETPIEEQVNAPEPNTQVKLEAAAEPPVEIKPAPEAEVISEQQNKTSRPLSPYPSYPDFKPPSSPSPSTP